MIRRSLFLFATVAAFGATLRVADAADVGVKAAVLETENGYFFEQHDESARSGPISYVPKLITEMGPSGRAGAPLGEVQATLRFRTLSNADSAQVKATFGNRPLVPQAVTFDGECAIHLPPPLVLGRQEVSAKGRAITALDTIPVCKFIFYMPIFAFSALNTAKANADAGTLITKPGPLVVRVGATVEWAKVADDVRRRVVLGCYPSLDRNEATFLLGVSLGQDAALAKRINEASAPTKTALVNDGFGRVFEFFPDAGHRCVVAHATGEFLVGEEKHYEL